MRQLLGGLIAVGLALQLLGPARADDQGQVGPIIDKAINALGGEENLNKWKAATWKAKGTFYGLGEGIPYTSEVAAQWPDRIRTTIEGELNGQKFTFVNIVNGGKGWMRANGETMALEGDRLDEAKEEVYASYVATLTPLKSNSFTLTSLGNSKVDGHEVVGVKVASKGHRDISIFFDKETGLPVKTERKVKDVMAGGDELMQETLMSDYKEIQETKHPMKVIIKRDGKKYIEQENSDMKLAEKLDDKLFSEPKE
jgi:hypothetical protein